MGIGVKDNYIRTIPINSAIEVVWAGSSPATPLVAYTCRADSLRSTKTLTTTGTTTYTWDLNAGLPVVLHDGSQSYVYGLIGLISQTDITGTQSYFLGNGLGSTESLTDGSGNVVGTYKYDIFGAVWASTGSRSIEYRFTGQQDDATLGYTCWEHVGSSELVEAGGGQAPTLRRLRAIIDDAAAGGGVGWGLIPYVSFRLPRSFGRGSAWEDGMDVFSGQALGFGLVVLGESAFQDLL